MEVDGSGTVDAAHSDGVVQANVSHPSSGVYCIDGLTPGVRTVVASVGFNAGNSVHVYAGEDPPAGRVCHGFQIGVLTIVGITRTDEPFNLIIH